MREITLTQREEGKRFDRWLYKELPALPMSLGQKYLRLKRFKVNGKPAHKDTALHAGDVVSLYIGDEFIEKPREVDRFLANIAWRLNRLYEDEHILLVEKPAGMIVHPDADEKINTLLNHVRAYLYQSGQWDSKDPGQFAPVLCNRIDRFTGGIVIAAKPEAAMHAMNQKIRDREIGKYYLAIARGNVRPDEGLMDNYLLKPEGSRKVRILDRPAPGAQRAQTAYRVLSRGRGLTLVECKLLTGRTHQIRAQFAHAGWPLLGDNQYGDFRDNARFDREYQALYAYRLSFDFTSDAGVLGYLAGKSFSVCEAPFVREYFPNVELP